MHLSLVVILYNTAHHVRVTTHDMGGVEVLSRPCVRFDFHAFQISKNVAYAHVGSG